ncbi:hypothetical protein D3C85_1563680 [compost metagenome]
MAIGQPQRGIHHVKIIVQQREAQIVWTNAVSAMFIHSQRRRRVKSSFEILIERSKAAIKPDH